jgi:pilus assembly protein CpaD
MLTLGLGLGGCYHREQSVQISADYRQNHRIGIKEGDRSLVVFVGSNRGELTPTQRAEVVAFGQDWQRDATGGIVIDVPVRTPNARAAADSLREIKSLLAAAQVPSTAIRVHQYTPYSPYKFAAVKINYPRVMAEAGPCGLWPKDLGPDNDPEWLENRPYWNFGCASQRNLAAMVENPEDLVQPRSETPAYTSRRSFMLDKYRKGESPSTIYQNKDQGKISDVGK